MTLDGVMEGNEKWRFGYASDDLAKYDMEKVNTNALLLGRKTYEIFASFWPNQKHNEFGIADTLNNLPKYVVSSTMKEANWNNTTIVKGDIANEIGRLKQNFEGSIGVTGSALLVQLLTKNQLVDQYDLLVFPIILGQGKRLFEGEPVIL